MASAFVEKLKKMASLGKFFKWLLLILAATICGLIIAGIFWLNMNPVSKFEKTIQEQIKKVTHAEKTYWDSMKWSFQLSGLKMGVKSKNFVVEKGNGFQRILIPELHAAVSLWKLLFFKIPLTIELEDALVEVAQIEKKEEVKEPIILPSWLSRVSVNMELKKAHIFFRPSNEKDIFEVKNLEMKFHMVGFPGSLSLETEFEPVLSFSNNSYILTKKTKISLEGVSSSFSNKLAKIELEKFLINMDSNLFLAHSVFEKIPDMPFHLSLPSTFVVSREGELDSFFVKDGALKLSELNNRISVQYERNKKTNFELSLTREHYKNLQLPFKYLRTLPLFGTIEWNFNYNYDYVKQPKVDWKVTLNNLTSDITHLTSLVDNGAKGPLILSLITEGHYEDGFIDAPRFEFQANATDANFSILKGQIFKKQGEKLEVFTKGNITRDLLSLDKLNISLNTLNMQGLGKMDQVSNLLKGKSSFAKFSFFTNRINLRDWSGDLQFINQSPPLDGFFELAGELNAELKNNQNLLDSINWRLDRAFLSNVKGIFNSKELLKTGFVNKDTTIEGGFAVDLLCSARGQGSVIHKANIKGDINLNELAFVWNNKFLKEAGVPFRLRTSIEASQNEIQIQQGDFTLHTLSLGMQGKLKYGSQRSLLLLNMRKPISLSEWKKFFPNTDVPLKGNILWNGWLGFSAPNEGFGGDVDMKKVMLKGTLKFDKIRGKLPGSSTELKEANAELHFDDKSLRFEKASMAWDNNLLHLNGQSSPLNMNHKNMSVFDLVNNKNWLHKYKVVVDHFDTNVSSNKSDTFEKPFDLIEALKHPYIEGSEMDLDFRIEKANLADIPFENLSGHSYWKNHQFNINPLQVKSLGGMMDGSLTLNAKEFYLRNQDPTVDATLKVKGLNLKELVANVKPEMSDVVGGILDGQLILNSQGFLVDDLIKKAGGRLQGKLRDGFFASFKVLKTQIDSRIGQDDLRKWLTKEAAQESCIQDRFDADLDAEIKDGQVKVSQSGFQFLKTKSNIELNGVLSADLNLKMNGNFYAGERCLGGDVRQCLQKNKEGAAIPFTLNGNATQPQAKLDFAALTRQIQLCIKDKIKVEAQEKIKSEIKNNSTLQKLQDQTVNKLQQIFKGR